MDIITLLNLILIVVVALIMILALVGFLFYMKSKKAKQGELITSEDGKSKNVTSTGLSKESIYKFMDFDEIKDNMIVRKNRQQYVMVVQCQGVNYDLLSEEEKVAVEEGFVQFLNTLRFPIQLYVQTRSLNLKEIIEEYKARVKTMNEEIEALNVKIVEAQNKGNKEQSDRLLYEKRRKENVLEYGSDIVEYVSRMSQNKNVLQQKNYLVVSYFVSEFGASSNYSKEEIDNICFGELYTRCQSCIRSLASTGVTGRVLDSEELTELLYVAYNRDDSELLQLSKALDSQYDALYSTAKDVLKKKEEQIEEQLQVEAVNIATDSIVQADNKRKKVMDEDTKQEEIKKRALALVEEYREQMDEDLYEKTKREIELQTTKKLAKKTTKRRAKTVEENNQ